jgi:Protein of unknown function (DUF998)
VAILHLLRTDLPPVAHRLSEYANGPYGWVMALAFAALGCGLIALGVSLWSARQSGPLAWIIPATAFLAGGGAIVSGMFRTEISATSELVHSSASGLATLALVILCLAYSIPILRRAAVRPDSVGTALAVVATILAAISPLLHETRWTGLSQRLLWFALLAWLLWTTWHRA